MGTIKQSIRISLSLVALTLCIFLAANGLGFVPDTSEAQLRERVILTENMADICSAVIQQGSLATISLTFDAVANRNEQIVSIALFKADGTVAANYGDHSQQRRENQSTPDFMTVPIFKDKELWGSVEVNFVPLKKNYTFGVIEASFFQLILFISIFGFILYLILVRKILRHLDPFKAVPARVKKALNAISEGVVIIDAGENIVLANEAFENKVDSHSNKLVGKKLSGLSWSFPDRADEKDNKLPWKKTLKDGQAYTHTTINLHLSNNTNLTLIVNSTPLQDAKGDIRGVLISFSDVTEFERMNLDLENIASFLRHELNNALVGATGTMIALEKNEQLSDEGKELLRLTQQSHSVISYLLKSVREAKSIEASFKEDAIESIRLDQIIKDAVDRYKGIYTEHSFSFETDGHALVARGQEERLIQMLDKLASNAVEHSDKNTTIALSCKKLNDRAFISIKNQGKALPADKQKIFDLFASFRNKNTSAHNQGIGLYVVKLIAETYGGSVIAKDRKDKTGAEFVIELPIAK